MRGSRPRRTSGIVSPLSWSRRVLPVEGIAVEWSAVFIRVGGCDEPAGSRRRFSAGWRRRASSGIASGHASANAVARLGASSAFVALAVMLVVHRVVPTVAALGIVGLGLGPVVPLAFRTAGRTPRRGHASALPLVVTAGYAGSIVGPLLVGFIADLASLRIACRAARRLGGVGTRRGSDP